MSPVLNHIDHLKKKNSSGFKEGKNLSTQKCRLVDNGYKIEIIFSMYLQNYSSTQNVGQC